MPLRPLAAALFPLLCAALAAPGTLVGAASHSKPDGNRLAYLDAPADPYYVSRTFPKLVTPQWVGEPGVEAVVVLAIDDMRDPRVYEAMLRPILERLKQIDGRAGVSIMTNQVGPADPQLRAWLKEGVSIDAHTFDHPCPLLAGGDFAKAKGTYDRCVDLLAGIAGNTPLAFRMPCCDSLNTPGPRFWAEIFNKKTPGGRFLTIDSSVFNLTTSADPDLPRELVLEQPGGAERLLKYVPFPSFVNTIENYPYPYVIAGLCWELPCATPSDWQAQNLNQANHPRTVEDMKAALDATVVKQGTFNLVFHPHGWIRNTQIVEMIDYAVKKHGKKVKFLSFKEVQERLDANLLGGQALRASDGGDNGVRLLDLNNDGYQDVVIGNEKLKQTRVWSPDDGRWVAGDFPVRLVIADAKGGRTDAGVRFGVVESSGRASLLVHGEGLSGAWHFDGTKWVEDKSLLAGLDAGAGAGGLIFTSHQGRDGGVRLRDLDGDGRCEIVVTNERQNATFAWSPDAHAWKRLSFTLPAGTAVVDAQGRDAGLRFVDVNEDGFDDVVFSNGDRYSLHLFTSMNDGWGREVISGKRSEGKADALPMIVRADGTDNGVWFHSRHLWVQNEDTAGLPNLVDRRSFDALLKGVQPGPKTAAAALETMRPRPGFRIELVAGEPLLGDPIAFDWGADGKLWVVEMGDYPLGVDGNGKPGGVVKCLEDADGNGQYEKATIFLEGLGFPTGVTAWRDGAIVTAAPDVFYAEDTDGDGKADVRKVLFTGFAEGNQQHRVNGFAHGLDNWLYGANGHSGGTITSTKTGEQVELGAGRDFRLRPDDGAFDPETGVSQFGRSRDDWGNWFGCDNSNPMVHYALSDHYLRRNPHVAPPQVRLQVPEVPGPAPIFPISVTHERFNEPHNVNRLTSANSVIIYRDDLFGPDYAGGRSWFVSEPVHNLIHREVMEPRGATFFSRRAADEKQSEFLTSTDNWFRPTMIKTGPDGAIWIADMYRHVIEHPEWIPKDWQARLDLRAGHDKGRIYRVYPVGAKLRTIPRLDKLDTAGLVAALNSPNGWQRDTAQRLLVHRADRAAVPMLENAAAGSTIALGRLHALCTLDGLGALSPAVVQKALADEHPGVRRHAVRLCEGLIAKSPELAAAMVKLVADQDPHVRLQLACTLGEWDDPTAGEMLGQLVLLAEGDELLGGAVMSSVTKANLQPMLAAVMAGGKEKSPSTALLSALLKLGGAMGDTGVTVKLLDAVATPRDGKYTAWQFEALGGLLDALEGGDSLSQTVKQSGDGAKALQEKLAGLFDAARAVAADANATPERRASAVPLLGRGLDRHGDDVGLLAQLLAPQSPPEVQAAAVAGLSKIRGDDDDVMSTLLRGWRSAGPALRVAILDALLGRAEWIDPTLSLLETGRIGPAEVDATRRQRLLQHAEQSVRDRAAKLFADVTNPDRQKVLDAFAPALSLEGEASRGQEFFTKLCAACHQLGGAGNPIGPDLAALSDKSPEYLLPHILDPNRAVEARYANYVVETKKNATLSGILAGESGNGVTILGADGKPQTVLRNDIKTFRSTGTSLMPEGLVTGLEPQDLADLMAYVRGSAPPPQRKTFQGNTPQLVRPGPDGSLVLLASNAEIFGSTLVFEPRYSNLGYWASEDDHAVWGAEPARPGKYAVWLEWACDDATAGNSVVLQTGPHRLTHKVAGTGNWDTYKRQKIGEITLRLGRQRVTFRSAGKLSGALIDLKSIELVPASRE